MNAIPEIRPAASTLFGPSFLHPTDFGPTGRLALAHAVALSQQARARLTLLHIRPESEAGPTRNGLGPVIDLLVRWGRLAPEERFADISARLGFSAACLDVPARSVSEGVVSHFEDHLVELAVLSTNPHSGLAYWFAGSVSRRVLRSANSMLLFLREGQRGFVDAATGDIKLARVLIPIDGRIAFEVAIRRALTLIDGLGVKVEKRLLHVGQTAPPGCPKDIPMMLAQGPVDDAILNAAKSFNADLIVMPTAGKRGVLAAFRNSVTAKILEDARWPILSVPALAAEAR